MSYNPQIANRKSQAVVAPVLAAFFLATAAFNAHAADFTLSCPVGTPVGTVVTERFYTGTAGNWQYLSSVGGTVWANALIEPRVSHNNSYYYAGWFDATPLGGDWISPAHEASTPVNQPYYFRSPAFRAAANIDPATFTVSALRVGADNLFKAVSIGNADRSTIHVTQAGPAPNSSTASATTPTSVPLAASFTAEPLNGKHLFLHVANNESVHAPINSGRGGPLGAWAEITVQGTCQTPPTPAAVPVNAPWALGLLGAAVGWLGIRAKRKQRG